MLGAEALEIQRDPDAIGGAGAEIAVQLHQNPPCVIRHSGAMRKHRTRNLKIPDSAL
jgi:hypothetical protein